MLQLILIGLGIFILWGIMFGALALGGFYIGELTTQELAGGQTLAFMTLALSQVFHSYNMRSKRSLFKIGIFTNHKLNWATLLSLVLVAIVLFTPLSVPFGLITLPVELYLLGLGFAFIPVIVMEISKAISSAIKQ